jgi:hypothetical protein
VGRGWPTPCLCPPDDAEDVPTLLSGSGGDQPGRCSGLSGGFTQPGISRELPEIRATIPTRE